LRKDWSQPIVWDLNGTRQKEQLTKRDLTEQDWQKFQSRSFRSEQWKSCQNNMRLKWNETKGKINEMRHKENEIGKNLSLAHTC